jgi:membrane carboxypeptidase/penicillin-binding protein
MEPQTGYIKAMVGGVDYAKSQYNIAAYGHRQPGSSFKPVIYTAALDSGLINENTRISDSPITLPGANGHNWTPHNDPGYIPSSEPKVWEAFAWSMNIPAVKVLRLVGVDTAIHYASIMGISSPLEPYLTLALGASAVTPLEMARMYSLIANQGALPTPEAIESITQSDGTVIEQDQPELETTSIRSDTLRQMGDMLRAVITDGTASKVFEDGNPPDAHGKTGTTQEHRDVWFDGYTSKLTCIVWAGHPSTDPVTGKPIYLPMHGEAFGATICAPIWKQFMIAANTVIAKQAAKEAAATKKTVTASSAAAKPKTPAAPVPTNATANPNVSSTSDAVYSADGKSVMVWVDDSTGMRASPNATGARQETFVPGSEPTTYADGSTATDTPPPARVTSSPTTETAPATSTSPPLESSVPLPSAPPTAPTPTPPVVHTNVVPSAAATPAEPKMVTVSICVESGMRATEWCPETIDKQFPANKIPKYCTLHKPPPGE